jgi:hypothetical protein
VEEWEGKRETRTSLTSLRMTKVEPRRELVGSKRKKEDDESGERSRKRRKIFPCASVPLSELAGAEVRARVRLVLDARTWMEGDEVREKH